jgi:putative protein kinase ArgK-like GTPase of G3E family
VVRTIATTDAGIDELEQAVDQFWSWLAQEGRLTARREMHWRARVIDMVRHELMRALRGRGLSDQALAKISQQVVAGQQNPYQLVPQLLEQLIRR